jgi:hypothetical protein
MEHYMVFFTVWAKYMGSCEHHAMTFTRSAGSHHVRPRFMLDVHKHLNPCIIHLTTLHLPKLTTLCATKGCQVYPSSEHRTLHDKTCSHVPFDT